MFALMILLNGSVWFGFLSSSLYFSALIAISPRTAYCTFLMRGLSVDGAKQDIVRVVVRRWSSTKRVVVKDRSIIDSFYLLLALSRVSLSSVQLKPRQKLDPFSVGRGAVDTGPYVDLIVRGLALRYP